MFETTQEAKEIIGEMTLDRFSEAERWALNMAIEALKKQEMSSVCQNYECPDCGCDLISCCHISDFKYCPNCGKKLGWKEDYD